METLTIEPINNAYSQQIVDLIIPIQQIEFNVPVTLHDQPDLLDVETYYHLTGGNFWGAFAGDELVGTIAMIATAEHSCALRKMFVKKEFRGKTSGTAQMLLNVLMSYCHEKGIKDIYLGTVDMLKAAHRFYERNGFEKIKVEELPSYFPRMASDNVYYHLHLSSK